MQRISYLPRVLVVLCWEPLTASREVIVSGKPLLGLELTVGTNTEQFFLRNPETWGPSSTFKYTLVSFQYYTVLERFS